jgi:hypothetical protein
MKWKSEKDVDNIQAVKPIEDFKYEAERGT